MDIIKSFFAEYGYSFLTLILFGVLAGLFLEITVKKAFTSAINKAGETAPKLEKAKSIVYAVFAAVFSIWFAAGVFQVMPLPCGVMAFPAWVFFVYVAQYVTSLYGINGIKDAIDKRRTKAESKETPVLYPTSVKGVFKDANGNLVDKHNNPVVL